MWWPGRSGSTVPGSFSQRKARTVTATPYHGQELSPRVEDASHRGRQLAAARRYKIAAVVLLVAYLGLLGWLGYAEYPLNGNDWSSIITGAVCGTFVFFGVPWSIGATKQRRTVERLYLNGTRLTVVGIPGRKDTTDLDLTRTRAEVRLDWLVDSDLINAKGLTQEQRDTRITLVMKNLDRQIANGAVPCVYAPVLLLYREPDGHKFAIQLADNKTRRMRAAAEIHALERAMQFASDPAIQHAAGQLRTVARWRRLPAIFDARPDVIPATPADHPATAGPIPTPVQRGEAAPEITVTGPIKP